MKYACSVCGYVHDEATGGKWDELPSDWKCPICGAGKDAFKLKENKPKAEATTLKPHTEKELSLWKWQTFFEVYKENY